MPRRGLKASGKWPDTILAQGHGQVGQCMQAVLQGRLRGCWAEEDCFERERKIARERARERAKERESERERARAFDQKERQKAKRGRESARLVCEVVEGRTI